MIYILRSDLWPYWIHTSVLSLVILTRNMSWWKWKKCIWLTEMCLKKVKKKRNFCTDILSLKMAFLFGVLLHSGSFCVKATGWKPGPPGGRRNFEIFGPQISTYNTQMGRREGPKMTPNVSKYLKFFSLRSTKWKQSLIYIDFNTSCLTPSPPPHTHTHTQTLLEFLRLCTYENLHRYEMRLGAFNNRIDWRDSLVYLYKFKALYQCMDHSSLMYLGRSSIQNKSCWKIRKVYVTFNRWFQQKRGTVMHMIISTVIGSLL